MPLYALFIYFKVSPKYYLRQNIQYLELYVGIVSIVVPLLLLLVLNHSKRIESYRLKNPQERMIFGAMMIGVYYVIFDKIKVHQQFVELFPFFLGVLLTILVLSLFNFWQQKPSIHAAGISGVLAFFLIWSFYTQINILIVISALILIGSLIIAARLYLKQHSVSEILWGTSIGILMQFAGFLYSYWVY